MEDIHIYIKGESPLKRRNQPTYREDGFEGESYYDFMWRYDRWREELLKMGLPVKQIPQFPAWDKDIMSFAMYLQWVNVFAKIKNDKKKQGYWGLIINKYKNVFYFFISFIIVYLLLVWVIEGNDLFYVYASAYDGDDFINMHEEIESIFRFKALIVYLPILSFSFTSLGALVIKLLKKD